MTPWWVILLAGLIPFGMARVPSAEGEEGRLGTLEVHLTDHREAIEDFERVLVRVEGVRLHPSGLPRRKGWMTLATDVSAEIRSLAGRGPFLLLRRTLAPREFDGVAISVGAIEAVLKGGEKAMVKDLTSPVALRFSLEAGKTTLVTLDLAVIGVGDHRGHPYELHLRGAFVGPRPTRPPGVLKRREER